MNSIDILLSLGLFVQWWCAILSQRIALFIGLRLHLPRMLAHVFWVAAPLCRSFDGCFAAGATNVLDLAISCWRGSLACIARIIVILAFMCGNEPVLRFGVSLALCIWHKALVTIGANKNKVALATLARHQGSKGNNDVEDRYHPGGMYR